MPSSTVTAILFRAVYVLAHATLICLCATAGAMSSFMILIIIQTFLWDAWPAKFMLMQALLFELVSFSIALFEGSSGHCSLAVRMYGGTLKVTGATLNQSILVSS